MAGKPLGLWTADQLAEPKNAARARAERAIHALPAPDLSAPARMVPLESLPILPEARRGIIRRVTLPAGDRRVALTFDLCERTVHVTGYDARLVDALRQANAKATFFAGGKWLRSHPERALQLMADPRFELGNHSWTHANMAVAPEAIRKQQVEWTSAQFELLREELDRRLAAHGLPASERGPLKLFRLPYGRGGAEVAQFLNGLGLAVIQWDVVGEGGRGNAQARAQVIADAVRPGSIVLLHANAVPRDTAEVVRRLLPLLAHKGYATATVSELLDAGRPETVAEGYFSFPGDNAIYDTLFTGDGTGPRAARFRKSR
ncbi:MAG: polysaccharide deacetylase family protein [Humidesulfovibrio sp.]|nr:polysaccharide deacetylase family protein [Humidesulfovibrio sp.]